MLSRFVPTQKHLRDSILPCTFVPSDCALDVLFANLVQYANFFFISDLFLQILCDGSVARHFESGENIFNAMVTFLTTNGLILPLLGLPIETVEAFRGFAIFRLLRICKHFFLKPIWLMLIKAAGALVSVMNLCLFNTLVTIMWYAIGRSLFEGSLDGNVRFNYSSMSRGYMTLLAVMTGDGWSDLMYEAMAIFCVGGGLLDVCDNFYVTMAALFYMAWFFYGQFLFITMFLAIILEAFAVEEFMTAAQAEDDEKLLDEDEARAEGERHFEALREALSGIRDGASRDKQGVNLLLTTSLDAWVCGSCKVSKSARLVRAQRPHQACLYETSRWKLQDSK